MENYIEIAVARKNSLKDTAVCFLCSMLPLLIGTYLVVILYASSASTLLLLGIVACALLYFLAYKIFCSFNIEWEYTLVGNELRFSKIINKNKRREIMSVNFSKVETVARTDDNGNNRQFKTLQVPKYNLTSQTNAQTYFMICTNEKRKKVCVVFEPDDRMKENFKTTLRGKFFE